MYGKLGLQLIEIVVEGFLRKVLDPNSKICDLHIVFVDLLLLVVKSSR